MNTEIETKLGVNHEQPLSGRLVRLIAFDPERYAADIARWNQNSDYQQLGSSGPAMLWTPGQIKEWLTNHLNEIYGFAIQVVEDGKVIGDVNLSGINWTAGDCYVGIGIGEREYWGKGYGTEAMNLVLRFGFESLNLKRVSLNVFAYNERAVRSYIKCGFKEEGRLRQWMQRGGERYDLIYMGILREEWEAAEAQRERALAESR